MIELGRKIFLNRSRTEDGHGTENGLDRIRDERWTWDRNGLHRIQSGIGPDGTGTENRPRRESGDSDVIALGIEYALDFWDWN